MNVLLVYPEYPNTFWSFHHALSFLSFIGRKAAFPPLGLLTVAALLPEEWELRLVDMNVRRLHDHDLAWADMVLVSAMLVQKGSAQEVLDRAKSFGKRTVVGGPFFTSCEKSSVRGADHWVLNEAEVTLPEFLKDLAQGTPKSEYTSQDKPRLETTPLPRWDLISLRRYATMAIQYTRGCPFACEFCDITKLYGRVTRLKKSSQFVTEVDTLYRAGWRGSVFIVDDNFVGNMVKVKEMLPELIAWQKTHRYPFTFFTEASVNLAKDAALLGLMQAAGFTKVFLGIETPRRESLVECHKGQNVNVDLAAMVHSIQSYGIEVLAGFIVGFDNDGPGIFADQIAFIQKTGIASAMVGLLTALPKTELWKRLHENGRLLKESTGDNLSAMLNFVPVMDREVLIEGYKRILEHIYSPREYYQRVHTLLARFRPATQIRFKREDIIAFLQSTVRIGIFSQARFLYWKLMLRHFARRTFPMAVTAAIMGEHYRKVARDVIRS